MKDSMVSTVGGLGTGNTVETKEGGVGTVNIYSLLVGIQKVEI